MKDMNEFRKMTPEDRDWEMYQELCSLACKTGNPCPDRYTKKEQLINRASAIGAGIGTILAILGIVFGVHN